MMSKWFKLMPVSLLGWAVIWCHALKPLINTHSPGISVLWKKGLGAWLAPGESEGERQQPEDREAQSCRKGVSGNEENEEKGDWEKH